MTADSYYIKKRSLVTFVTGEVSERAAALFFLKRSEKLILITANFFETSTVKRRTTHQLTEPEFDTLL